MTTTRSRAGSNQVANPEMKIGQNRMALPDLKGSRLRQTDCLDKSYRGGRCFSSSSLVTFFFTCNWSFSTRLM
jgi:hypothetical protein